MTYQVRSALAGSQPIAETSTTKKHELGQVVWAFDSTYGWGEFVYLVGVADTIVGSCVTYDVGTTWVTTLSAVGASLPRPVAFAMSANVASQYGWYQISGRAVAAKAVGTSLAAAAAIGVKTTGLVSASATGKELAGAIVAAVASAKSDVSTVTLVISRPHHSGRIT